MKMALHNRNSDSIVSQRESFLTPVPMVSILLIMIPPNWVEDFDFVRFVEKLPFLFAQNKSLLTLQNGSGDLGQVPASHEVHINGNNPRVCYVLTQRLVHFQGHQQSQKLCHSKFIPKISLSIIVDSIQQVQSRIRLVGVGFLFVL